ncbi:hypothetical protein L6164_020201 [Bauhinia variegata]|uniref:Uncharacterized protein n=1 Tax=Bauhinia variegata TaxID=167791 RepID=A0ACB9MUA4_BAUVA|nr:hypothetical protein L6164_020201 [Bauhinia variegata]
MGSKREEKLKKEKKKNKKDSLKSDHSPLVPESHGEEENAGGGGRKVVTDPRFSSVHRDPRFREAPKHETKVAIDSRFDRLFNDKRFLPSSAPVNKRGKPQKRNTQQGSLRHYYRTEEVEKVDDEDEKEVEESSEEEDEEEREREELVKPNRVKPGDEEGGDSETSEEEHQEETDESESSTDIDEDQGVYDDEMPDTQVLFSAQSGNSLIQS